MPLPSGVKTTSIGAAGLIAGMALMSIISSGGIEEKPSTQPALTKVICNQEKECWEMTMDDFDTAKAQAASILRDNKPLDFSDYSVILAIMNEKMKDDGGGVISGFDTRNEESFRASLATYLEE